MPHAQCKILIGDIAKSIVACTEKHSCDKLVIGSLAANVVHLTKLSITLVK